MVDRSLQLNCIFGSLSDPTRRDILRRVAQKELSIGDISKAYKLTFAAISKHLKVLAQAKLIVKRRHGKEQLVQMAPQTMNEAAQFLEEYKKLWDHRLDALEEYLKTMQ